jgi:hypothetical protein
MSAADLHAQGAVEVYADPAELCRHLDDSILTKEVLFKEVLSKEVLIRRSSPGLAGRSDE